VKYASHFTGQAARGIPEIQNVPYILLSGYPQNSRNPDEKRLHEF
jgi:hypothetical protein